jgi:hypothetical protein
MDRIVFYGLDPERLLLYLGAAAVAVLALYLVRTTRKRTVVTAGPVWERVIGRRRVSLRELLSYFLQVVVLAALLGTLSDPRDPSHETARRGLAIVLDASGTMLAREPTGRRIDLAKSAARDLVASLAEGDVAMVVRAGPWPAALTSWLGTAERTRLLEAIDTVDAEPRAADMAAAVRFAADALATVRPALSDRRVLALLSDRPHAGPPPAGKTYDVQQLLFGAAGDNVAVTDFDLRAARGLERGYDVFVRVHNYGHVPARLELGVHSDDVLFGKVPLALAPGADAERLYHLDLGASARSGVRVTAAAVGSSPPDALPVDDRAFGVLPEVRELPVVLVTAGNRFLEEVLRLNPEVKLSVKGPGAWEGKAGAGTLVVFDRVTPEPAALPANALLIDPMEGRAPFKVRKRVPRPKVTDWLGDHPLLKGATVRDLWIDEASLFAVDRADTALVSAEGGAVMALRESGGRRVLAIGFDLTRSDLPLRVAFPVFLRNVLRYFGGWADDEPGGPLVAPHFVARPLRVADDLPGAVGPTGGVAGPDVSGPDAVVLHALAYGGGRYVTPLLPGFYRVPDASATPVPGPAPAAPSGPGTAPGASAAAGVTVPVSSGRGLVGDVAPPSFAAPRPDRAGAVYLLASGVAPLAVKALFNAETPLPPRLYWVFLLLLAVAVATTDWILYFLRVLY